MCILHRNHNNMLLNQNRRADGIELATNTMISQVSEIIDSEGYHIVTAITDKGNVAVEKYFYESDKERAYENAQRRALDQD